MFCAFCGTEIPDDSLFCPSCGKRTGVQQNASTVEIAAQGDLSPSPDGGDKPSGISDAVTSPVELAEPEPQASQERNQEAAERQQTLSDPTQAGEQSQHPPREQSAAMPAATAKRPKRGLVIVAIAVSLACCVAAIVFFAHDQDWFSANEPVYVQTKSASSTTRDGESSPSTSENRFMFDKRGNLLEIDTENRGEGASQDGGTSYSSRKVSYSCDGNGYVSSMRLLIDDKRGISSYEDKIKYTADFQNETDEHGRLTKSTMSLPGGWAVTATYSYIGDTDAVDRVTYYDVKFGETVDGYNAATFFGQIPHFDNGAYFRVFKVGMLSMYPDQLGEPEIESCVCCYSEDGVLTSYIVNGVEEKTGYDSFAREKNGTVVSENDDYTVTTTYDENGCAIHAHTTGPASTTNSDYTWKRIDHPTKALKIFSRLDPNYTRAVTPI